jgi:hypothetical protein
MIIFLLELLKENTSDQSKIDELDSILSMNIVDSDFVEGEMKMELGYKEKDFTEKVDSINKLNISCESKKERLEKLLNRFTVSSNKLLYRLRSNQMDVISGSGLFKMFCDVVIVWDNAKAHIAHHVKDIMSFLGVRIVPLPVRCPNYNPIEYPWSDAKRETAKEPIDDENELKLFFKEQFCTLTEKNNYADYWFNLINEKREYYSDKLEIPAI